MHSFIFPGQGSQYIGMGGKLFDKYKNITDQTDSILGYSIKELCLEGKRNLLNQTEYAQPAIYVVNALEMYEKINEGLIPDFVAGHSLGEYNALFAAGVFDFITGLKLVQERGRLMSMSSNGAMAAVIGFCEKEVSDIIQFHNIENVYIANCNSQYQIVLSGLSENINNARTIFQNAGAKSYELLNVSGAFHSVYMQEPMEKFREYVKKFSFSKLKIPVISNVYAKPYDPFSIKNTLVNQMVSRVRWMDTILYLLRQKENEIIQVGPGNVLSKLVKRIIRENLQCNFSECQENTI